ncbi:hypothetical protein BGW80DRAFT_1280851 [Lactifluus volemus]|nr:hypothetical protein BGW80DRAFT_1280851 [Lactifluus volemus]
MVLSQRICSLSSMISLLSPAIIFPWLRIFYRPSTKIRTPSWANTTSLSLLKKLTCQRRYSDLKKRRIQLVLFCMLLKFYASTQG